MSRIPTPTTIALSPAGSQALLGMVQKQLGSVPNMFRVIGNSSAALEGYLGLNTAALRFAAEIVRQRGHVSEAELRRVKAAGYDDAQVIEIVLLVALNTLTNYVNSVVGTDIDFPVVTHDETKSTQQPGLTELGL